MMFLDRNDAGKKLAASLAPLRGEYPLVLALPRGAVPIANIVANALASELDIVLVRKLGAPGNPEYAMGAVDEYGSIELNPDIAQRFPVQEIKRIVDHEKNVLKHRHRIYRAAAAQISAAGRTVIVIDDGLATGITMTSALRVVATQHPKRLIAAVPVASKAAIERITPLADQVVCLYHPPYLGSISSFFRDFEQVSDDKVIDLLRAARKSDR